MQEDLTKHNIEIHRNLEYWNRKPLLQEIYHDFYQLINQFVDHSVEGSVLELGSGIGNIKTVIPDAICTDLFSNPWIDRVENAYDLSFRDNSISNIILFDVFHHIEHPGRALSEFYRVLAENGRVIVFEPAMSLTGLVVYGLFHHEPVSLGKKIIWEAPENFDPWNSGYYASQSNAEKVFFRNQYKKYLSLWDIIERKKFSSLTYILSGGYSKPQLFPSRLYKPIRSVEKLLDRIPVLFGTRMLVVLRKNE